MTVEKLIAELSRFPPNSTVLILSEDNTTVFDVLSVTSAAEIMEEGEYTPLGFGEADPDQTPVLQMDQIEIE